MKAAVLPGIKEALSIQAVPVPTIQAGEALVRIKAAALNRRDWWIQQGQYAGLKFPIILGSDGAGIVEKVASDQDRIWIGRAVIIDPAFHWGNQEAFQSKDFTILGLPQDGTLAQYVKVPIANLYEKPAHLPFEEAAGLPLVGVTTYRALFSRARLTKGEKLLIVGIGGGAATMALELARGMGAEIYVTSSSNEKIERAKLLGAKGGVNYTEDGWYEKLKGLSGGFDVILDSALGENFVHHLELANPGGRIVFFGGTAGNVPELNGRRIFWKQLSILGSTMGSPKDFQHMLQHVNQHHIKPVIDSIYPLDQVQEALRRMEDRSSFGKIIVQIPHSSY